MKINSLNLFQGNVSLFQMRFYLYFFKTCYCQNIEKSLICKTYIEIQYTFKKCISYEFYEFS